MPLGIRQVRVQYGHVGKSGLKPRPGLRSEADFRHKDDGLTPVLNHFVDRPNVNLGLSASRDTVHENRLMPPLAERPKNPVEGPQLIIVQLQMRFPWSGSLLDRDLLDAAHFD